MPKTRSEKPIGSFALYNKPNGKGEVCLYLRYYVGGTKYAKRSAEIWVLPEHWDQTKQVVISKNKNAARYNARLTEIKNRADKQISEYDGVISWQVIQKILDGGFLPGKEKAKGLFLIDYANYVNDLLYGRNEYGYSVYYNKRLNIKAFGNFIADFLNLPPLTIDQLTTEIIDKYINYRRDKRHNKSKEGINKTLVPIVKAIEYAKDNGLLDPGIAMPIIQNAYIDVKERVYDPDADTSKKVRYLTSEQFEQLREYTPKSNSKKRTKEILDVFFFSYYSCGIRISDIITLEWSQVDMERKVIDKVQVKTKVRGKVSPSLSDPAMEILSRWQKKKLNKRFVFNFLPESYVFSEDKESQHNFKMKCNAVERTLNQSLRKIGENLGFPYHLSMHVARHTFCVHAISSSMSLHWISQLMGHQSILATEKTYADFLDETIDEEMGKINKIFAAK